MTFDLATLEQGTSMVPEHVRQRQAQLGITSGNATGGSSTTLKIDDGGYFKVSINGENLDLSVLENRGRDFMDVIIVGATPDYNRQFFADGYSEDGGTAPTCISADGKAPHPSVPAEQRQNATCEGCPRATKGSAGGTYVACKIRKRIAVICPALVVIDKAFATTPLLVDLPGGAIFDNSRSDEGRNLFTWQSLVNKLAKHGGIDPALMALRLHNIKDGMLWEPTGFIEDKMADLQDAVIAKASSPIEQMLAVSLNAGSSVPKAVAAPAPAPEPASAPAPATTSATTIDLDDLVASV